ncbi:signal peptidase I [Formosa sp. 4Alg 33]|uniref:signal peptidase I n=1 Tax=Formosa sp. 4Alg 33 TaxID=3382189 RepID=UPI003D9C64AD
MKSIKKKYLVLLTILVILSVLRLFWLCLALIILTLGFWGVNYLLDLIKYKVIKKLCKGVFLFLMLLFVAIGIRVFIADIYLIPSSSMENTLYPKDVILVNKLKYGPSLPRSPYEIPWVNIYYLLQDNTKEAVTKKHWEAKRLVGTSTIKQGDVMVFKNFKRDVVFVKRCVGIAGDTFKIVNGEIYINNTLYNAPKHIRNTYAFKVKQPEILYKTIDSLHINTRFYSLKNDGHWKEAELSYLEKEKLQSLGVIDSVMPLDDTNALKKINLFPIYDKDKAWTLDNYGPIVIPKVGMQIHLTDDNLKLYSRLLKKHENTIIKKRDNHFFIGEKIVTSYTFKKNYYFMMGDNRKYSRDSRYFGFVPEEKIIGKVQCVLFSNKDDDFQWNRLFKGV